MESLKKSDKFLELLKKFQVTKPPNSSTAGKVVKRPVVKIRDSGGAISTACRRNIPILKPTPTKPSTGNPNFVSPPHNHRSAFVPVLSPMKPKDYMESVTKLRSSQSVHPSDFSLDEKCPVYDEMESCEHGTSNNNHSSSRDSGFEPSNPLNSSYCSASKNTSPVQMKARRLQNIPENPYRHSKAPSPVFVRPKTPPYKPRTAEKLWVKTQTDFVETVRSFTSQNMFTTPEILFHLNNLQLNITKKISKSIFLNRISSREKIRLRSDENAGSKNQLLMSWLLNSGV
uniref:Uncharacterized protein n=1 Tax=Lygus hesperus TaxID=30085 RepID=A0A146LNI7_LYGHE